MRSGLNRPSGAEDGAIGFTLIELLVVLAIILILASLIAPAVLRGIDLSRRVTCMSNQRQVGLGVSMYAQDHDDAKPPFHDGAIPIKPIFTSTNVKQWDRLVGLGLLIEDYVETHEIFLCQGVVPAMDNNSDRDMWLNDALVGSSYFYEWFHAMPRNYELRTEAELEQFRQTSLLSAAPAGQAMVMDVNCRYWAQYQGEVFAHRPLGTCNVLFHDGHVGYFPYEEGLVAKNDKRYNLWLIWENAHRLGTAAMP